jgi:hypothetical protein
MPFVVGAAAFDLWKGHSEEEAIESISNEHNIDNIFTDTPQEEEEGYDWSQWYDPMGVFDE